MIHAKRVRTTKPKDDQFPLEEPVRYYPFADVNRAMDDGASGAVVEPILRMAAA